MGELAKMHDDRAHGLANSVRAVLAFSVLMLGLAATIAIPPTLIWIFAVRGLQ